jgi:hypothetical protein
MSLGRLDDAEQMFSRVTDQGARPGYLSLVAYARNDDDRARSLLRDYNVAPGMTSAIIGARLDFEDPNTSDPFGPSRRRLGCGRR